RRIAECRQYAQMMSWRMLAGSGLLPMTPSNHRENFALSETIDRESRPVRPPDPGRLELWTERHNQQHRKGASPIDDPTERFQARGVGPVRVLEDHQQGGFAATMPPLAR